MKKRLIQMLTLIAALSSLVACHSHASQYPKIEEMHTTTKKPEVVAISNVEYPKIEPMHAMAKNPDVVTVSNVEWIVPDEALFYSESSLIVRATVTSTEAIKYVESEESYTPFSIHHLTLTEIFRNDSQNHKLGDEISIVQEFNSESYPTDLRLAEAGHEYIFFLMPSESLKEDYPLLTNKADYYFAYSYHCPYEKVGNWYVSLPAFRDYSTQPKNLKVTLGASFDENEGAIHYKLPATSGHDLMDLPKLLDLKADQYAWLDKGQPILHHADEFTASIRERVMRYPYEK